ncbi:MAG: 4Fe-4S dicluster domain-containing protein [Hyphomicrobiaceae bacterium]
MPEQGLGNEHAVGGDAVAGGAPLVRLRASACVSVQRPGRPCSSCASTCPVDAIRIGERAIEIAAADCVGCGRCEAACPTGAIAVDGFELPPSRAVWLDCSRVPSGERTPADVVVPCLGGLAADALRERLSDPDAQVVIVDRGWCGTCTLGGSTAPWGDTVERVTADLHAIGRSPRQLRVERRELPVELAGPPPAPSGRTPPAPISRRQFFTRMTRPQPRSVEALRAAADHVAPARVDVLALRRRLEWLRGLSAKPTVPASVFASASIADTCCDHQVCVRVCPTGALAAPSEADLHATSFDPALCIACRACSEACPTRSITITERGSGPYIGPVVVRRSKGATCERCAADFVPRQGERACPACRKDAEMMRLGHGLFRRRPQVFEEHRES